jgi:hypothetical protein
MKMPSKGYMAPYCAFGHYLESSLTDGRSFDELLLAISEVGRTASGHACGGNHLEAISLHKRTKVKSIGQYGFWEQAWLASFCFRRFFVTREGYNSLSPRTTIAGDEVCLLCSTCTNGR